VRRPTIALQPTPQAASKIVRILATDFSSMVLPLQNAARLSSTVMPTNGKHFVCVDRA